MLSQRYVKNRKLKTGKYRTFKRRTNLIFYLPVVHFPLLQLVRHCLALRFPSPTFRPSLVAPAYFLPEISFLFWRCSPAFSMSTKMSAMCVARYSVETAAIDIVSVVARVFSVVRAWYRSRIHWPTNVSATLRSCHQDHSVIFCSIYNTDSIKRYSLRSHPIDRNIKLLTTSTLRNSSYQVWWQNVTCRIRTIV